jgi:NAD(P)-dependent dehydrogenase (short-subunit alcohol dehydrogenase family)
MTKVMAIEWAPHNVQVNAIGPTYFETPLVATLRDDPERFRFINERTPMGRWGQPEELEGTVVFLASKASDFITGQTIYVDGGWTIW